MPELVTVFQGIDLTTYASLLHTFVRMCQDVLTSGLLHVTTYEIPKILQASLPNRCEIGPAMSTPLDAQQSQERKCSYDII
jgi:hypothetical protein